VLIQARGVVNMDILVNLIKKKRKHENLSDITWQMQMNKPLSKAQIANDFGIVLINNPCFGYGDIIFCLKIYKYIKEWYGITPTIATTKPRPFQENGVSDIIGLKVPGKKYQECDNMKNMKTYYVDETGKMTRRMSMARRKYDLYLATPWIGTDYKPNYKTISHLFPHATRFNTFLFSEYNPSRPKMYDFATGVGKGLVGMLLTSQETSVSNVPKPLPNPYLMVHLTPDPRVNSHTCLYGFVKLMAKKYAASHPSLDIVIPTHLLENKPLFYKIKKHMIKQGYFDDVIVIEKNKPEPKHVGSKVLRFRADITPLPYDQYTSLFRYCLPDVLITGDQSVTDIVSCCRSYNIYYQLMPWKRSFARNLAKVIGAPYIKRASTSCGLEKMTIDQKQNLDNIVSQHDFRVIAKPKFDAIVRAALKRRTSKSLARFEHIVLSSRKTSTVLRKLLT
jgi:hypothetical protein